jgi:hypothetical protein
MQNVPCRPLCPIHHQIMTVDSDGPDAARLATSTSIEGRNYSCNVSGCRLNYSAELGYFALEENEDQWQATRSSSLRIQRRTTQAICGEQHQFFMYLESLDVTRDLENFRCPQEDCRRTLQVQRGEPPAYWLGERFFESS